jgi:hypothetical protein
VVKWLVQFVLPLSLAGAALGLVLGLGLWLKPPPVPSIRWTRFASLEVEAPPGLTREAFLEEVQAAAALPDALNLEAPGTAQRLREAFQAHPWVRLVSPLEQRGDGVRLHLDFRRPVLLVQAWNHPVDAEGVLLPQLRDASALVVDRTNRPLPTQRLGQHCPEVAEWAAAAAALPPRDELRGVEIELSNHRVRLRGPQFTVEYPRGDEAKLASLPALAGFAWTLGEEGVTKKALR